MLHQSVVDGLLAVTFGSLAFCLIALAIILYIDYKNKK